MVLVFPSGTLPLNSIMHSFFPPSVDYEVCVANKLCFISLFHEFLKWNYAESITSHCIELWAHTDNKVILCEMVRWIGHTSYDFISVGSLEALLQVHNSEFDPGK